MFWAYVLANPAGVMRVLLPTIILSYYKTWLILAAILWSTAFAILVIIYAYVPISPPDRWTSRLTEITGFNLFSPARPIVTAWNERFSAQSLSSP
jgi:VIT1/CCC1 family predicted Fe2+/Mn2+ transporter